MSIYYTLVTALPTLADLDNLERLPISRIALDQRLSMLPAEDTRQLELAERLYRLEPHNGEPMADLEVVSHWNEALEQIKSATLKDLLMQQLEVRTLLAAVRYRKAGMNRGDEFTGHSRWLMWIRKHWSEPMFGLEQQNTELTRLVTLIEQGHSNKAEQMLIRMYWQQLLQVERIQHFCFETVACFVLRWGLAEHWINASPEKASDYFNHLKAEALKPVQLQQRLDQEFGRQE